MNHPQCPEGHLYLGDFTESDFSNGLGWKTKKQGSSDTELKPCFVEIAEVQSRANDYEKAGKPEEAQDFHDLIKSGGPLSQADLNPV